MKKFVITTLASVFMLTCGSDALAQTARARIADTPIRVEADLASAIIARLKEGGPVDVVDLKGDWYRVLVPSEQGKPRVGYVLANLVEIVNTDGLPKSIQAPPASRASGPIASSLSIAPTPAQAALQRDRATERERALKAEVDALQADVKALQNDQPTGQIGVGQTSQPGAHNPQTRDGFWFNAGLGFGSLSCSDCDFALSGVSGGLSLGSTINDRLLFGVGTTGYYKPIARSTLSAGTLDARLRFYPVRTSGFFLTGGMGLGHISIDNETEYGVGVVLGLGWDIRVGSNVSLTPFWNGVGVATSSNSNASVGQLGLGITIH